MKYGEFSSGTRFFSDPLVIDARIYEEQLSWWANYGSSTKLLQSLVFKLLSQPVSSSCCERNWSMYATIQNVKKNKLTRTRAKDLLYVHANTGPLSREKKSTKKDLRNIGTYVS